MGLHPPLVKDLVAAQLGRDLRPVGSVASWRKDVVDHRRAAVVRQWGVHAAIAGASLAIADWLDGTK